MTEAAVEAALKDLRREEGNKRCFVCDERGPTYVDMDHAAFVCTTCAGIMREFTFKLKGLSMATFTSNEVKALKQTGVNTGATKVWLARFRSDKPKSGDKDNIRAFIKETFVLKKYAEKAKKQDVPSDDEDEEDEDERKSRLRKQSSSAKSAPRKGSVESVGEEDKPKPRKGSVSEEVKPKSTKLAVSIKPTQQQQKPSKQPAATNSLLDMDFGAPAASDGFDDFVSADPFSSAPAASKPQASSADPFDFGDFSAAVPAPAAQSVASDPFGSFSSAPVPSTVGQMSHPTSAVGMAPPQQHMQQSMGGYFGGATAQSQHQYPPQQQQQQPTGGFYQQQSSGNQVASSQQEQVLTMMGTMMGNISREETMARIQQNPQLMQYFTQMVQAMAPSPMSQPQQQQQGSWGVQQPQAQQGYVSTNPAKNPFVQAKLGNKVIVPVSDDFFGAFS